MCRVKKCTPAQQHRQPMQGDARRSSAGLKEMCVSGCAVAWLGLSPSELGGPSRGRGGQGAPAGHGDPLLGWKVFLRDAE
ncbi:hypothetical protein E2C01_029138 [Portunus trituberculatus]|uniref:Uncharacterized protein n=1 Tax=Portunus trituberculatus TaxID=210409 RepID=A0A5B7ER05_PORTR|nr:hypothetical protein [Portunus trituberculatus]